MRWVESKKAKMGPLGDRVCQETDSLWQVPPRQIPVEPAHSNHLFPLKGPGSVHLLVCCIWEGGEEKLGHISPFNSNWPSLRLAEPFIFQVPDLLGQFLNPEAQLRLS